MVQHGMGPVVDCAVRNVLELAARDAVGAWLPSDMGGR